ncbi:MAG: hypothetical protein ACO1SV_04680 [Fimbriimonas sp.]
MPVATEKVAADAKPAKARPAKDRDKAPAPSVAVRSSAKPAVPPVEKPRKGKPAAPAEIVPKPPAARPKGKTGKASVETSLAAEKITVRTAVPSPRAPAAEAVPKAPPLPKAKPEKSGEVLAKAEPAPKRSLLGQSAKPKATLKSGGSTRARGRDTRITVFVARGGPLRGDADYELAFPNRHQALAFLSNQHGLTIDEQRQLARASRLKLNRRWHGSEACILREVALDPDQAARVLQGELVAA